MRERDIRLLDDLMIRIHPVIVAIRDEAVAKAQVNSADLITRMTNNAQAAHMCWMAVDLAGIDSLRRSDADRRGA